MKDSKAVRYSAVVRSAAADGSGLSDGSSVGDAPHRAARSWLKPWEYGQRGRLLKKLAGFGLPVHKNSLRKGRFGMGKMSRRIVAMLLAFAMMASMGISALAVETENTENTTSSVADQDAETAPDTTTLVVTPEKDEPLTTADPSQTGTPDTTTTENPPAPAAPDNAVNIDQPEIQTDDLLTGDESNAMDDGIVPAANDNAVQVGKSISLAGSEGYFHKWSSSDKSIATVFGNDKTAMVTGVGEGDVTITHKYKSSVMGKEKTETFAVTVTGSSGSDTTYGYFYVHVPGTEDNSALYYTEAWIYAGRSDIGSDPQDREDAILATEPTSLEGVAESNTLGFPYPSIVIENESYTYDKDLGASNTYKIVWDNLVYSNGANWPTYNKNNGGQMPAYSDNNTYIVNSGSSANCWHINGHIETIGQLATVKFEVEDDPEKNDW